MTYPLTFTNPPKRFPSIGECIYCGDVATARTDEHVLPFAIAGNTAIFEDASCESCQKALHGFEQSTLKSAFESIRIVVGAPSRNRRRGTKKKPPKQPIVSSGHREGEQLYLNRHTRFEPKGLPFGFTGLRLWPPRVLSGITVLADPPVDSVSQVDQQAILAMGLPEGAAVYVGKINPLEFARFLAKIAYSYVVADHGKSSFVPLLLPLLFGRRQVFTDLVGGDYDIPPAINEVHRMQSYVYDMGIARFRCVQIRLFANRGTPVYHVVVGLIRDGTPNYYEEAIGRQFAHSFETR